VCTALRMGRLHTVRTERVLAKRVVKEETEVVK
jgi:hypothetical protein